MRYALKTKTGDEIINYVWADSICEAMELFAIRKNLKVEDLVDIYTFDIADYEPLFDKLCLKLLKKINTEYLLTDKRYGIKFIRNKFLDIYEQLIIMNPQKLSVEYTMDNTLLFSLKYNNDKYLIQYHLDYEPKVMGDVEIFIHNLSDEEYIVYETTYSYLNRDLCKMFSIK